MLDALRTLSVCSTFSERESHDVTTTEIHQPASDWHNSPVLACWCVPGCVEAFFKTRSFDQDYKALGGDSFR
jgi:hypothetical protein